jgi:hypothetical protein
MFSYGTLKIVARSMSGTVALALLCGQAVSASSCGGLCDGAS